jgi:hypothetical protein
VGQYERLIFLTGIATNIKVGKRLRAERWFFFAQDVKIFTSANLFYIVMFG